MAPLRPSSAKPRSRHEQTRRLLSLFNPEDRVLIIIAADPDALGSSLAFKRLLWRRVAGITIARSNEIGRPDNLAMVRLLKIPLEPLDKIDPADFSKLVMVDGQPHHIKGLAGVSFTAVIDHHPPGEELEDIPLVDVRPRYGATSSILTEYLQGADIKPSTRLATALVYGIKNDTAGFQRPALEEDVKAFQFLFPRASLSFLRKIEFSEMRMRDLDILRQALEVYVARRRCIYVHLGPCKTPDNLVQLADFFLKIDSVDMTAVSGVYQDKLVIIIRNVGLRTSAGTVAERAFGHLGSAGGHQSMARAELPLATLRQQLGEISDHALARLVMHNIQHPPRLRKASGGPAC